MQCNVEDYITTVNYYHSSFNKRVRKIKKDHFFKILYICYARVVIKNYTS